MTDGERRGMQVSDIFFFFKYISRVHRLSTGVCVDKLTLKFYNRSHFLQNVLNLWEAGPPLGGRQAGILFMVTPSNQLGYEQA